MSSAGDRVFVRGLEFEGNHGYSAAERRGTRRFRVDLELAMPLAAAAASDRLADTVDYFKVSEIVVGIGTRSTYRLLEALAGEMARRIQELYPRVGVTITLDKLAPPCPGVPAACGVRLERPAPPPRAEAGAR
ncbi:MAG: dihydroneopterin aldolase [Kofleriaceae bacterium]|jgi:dihydroneopterin aldolase|nr:dihydroneopterin aldolase [Kofleriaceae bacterium]MBP6839582.1 dihydroneopterin aldolase [Kofleriaceae bacterium]MBP9207315.1 dihydroneopterin aldolase [Kofleriaceae bacterium]